jgi:hypothetical protein
MMQTREREKESLKDFKTHSEIEELFHELKELEEKYSDYKDIKPESKEELIEVGHEEEKINPSPIKKEKIKIKTIIENVEKNILRKPNFHFKIKVRRGSSKNNTQKTVKEVQPTTFRLRINEQGKLQNIDLKKPNTTEKRKIKFSIKNRKKREKEQETTKETSILDKFKGIFSKIGNLKRAIPSKSNDSEETKTPQEPEF